MDQEGYNSNMEYNKKLTAESYDTSLVDALEAHDASDLLEAVKNAPENEMLETMGLRVQVRDFWRNRKGELVHISNSDLGSVEANTKAMFTSMDDELEILATGDGPHEDMRAELANARRQALVGELERLNGDTALEVIERFGAVDQATLGTPDQILPWVFDWRSQIVETLWSVVQDYREKGDDATVRVHLTRATREVNDHLDKLMQGALYPKDS